MKSPFPGMDPYLEQYWGDVHTRLATYASDQIQKLLPPGLIARVEEHVAVEAKNDPTEFAEHGYYPDVPVVESPRGFTKRNAPSESVAVADTVRVRLDWEPMTQRSIHIVEPKTGDKVITAIELLSPANKVGLRGREAFRKKREKLIKGKVSLVEIDLIRDGSPNMAVPMNRVPVKYRGPYRVCVVRAWEDSGEVYRLSMRTRLPVISVPLRKKDREIGLDMQPLLDMVFENGRYDRTDYSIDPEPPLAPADAAWVDQLLREKGLRK